MKNLKDAQNEVFATLLNGPKSIAFTKADGTVRTMQAKVELADAEGFGGGPADCATVFDTVANGYRKFRWNSLIEVDDKIFDYID